LSFDFKYTTFNSGRPLSYCDSQICSFIRTLESRNHETSLLNIRPLLQLIRCLMGKNTLCRTKLTGDVVNEESLVRIITKSGDQNMLTWVHYQIALLNFIFGDFDRAAEEINMARPLTLTPFSSVEVGFVVMLDGLIHLAPGKHESISTARRCIRILRRVSRKGPNHLLRCLYLLQAELAARTGDEERAIVKFMSAIAMAVESHAIMDLGIALERFGALYTRLGQHESSVRYYRRALDTFRDWEAAAKVQQICELHPALR
jgi:histidine kinase